MKLLQIAEYNQTSINIRIVSKLVILVIILQIKRVQNWKLKLISYSGHKIPVKGQLSIISCFKRHYQLIIIWRVNADICPVLQETCLDIKFKKIDTCKNREIFKRQMSLQTRFLLQLLLQTQMSTDMN